MTGISLINVFDAARALGPEPEKATPKKVADWLVAEYLSKRGGTFNYDPATFASCDLFRGTTSLDAAIHYCKTMGNPKRRDQNTEVIKLVGPYAIENVSRVYRIGFTAIAVGRVRSHTVYLGIKAPIVRVKGSEAFVVVPGFRRSYRPMSKEIDFACSVALANFARDDFSEADFEYLSAGPGASGEREFQAILGRNRIIYSGDELDCILDVYVQGLALAVDFGAELRSPKLEGYRIIDPREPPLPTAR